MYQTEESLIIWSCLCGLVDQIGAICVSQALTCKHILSIWLIMHVAHRKIVPSGIFICSFPKTFSQFFPLFYLAAFAAIQQGRTEF